METQYCHLHISQHFNSGIKILYITVPSYIFGKISIFRHIKTLYIQWPHSTEVAAWKIYFLHLHWLHINWHHGLLKIMQDMRYPEQWRFKSWTSELWHHVVMW